MCKECTISVLRKWGVKILTSAHSFQMHSFIFLFCCSETSTSAQQICIKDFQPGSVHTLYKIPSAMWYQFRKLFWGEKWKLWSCTYRLSYNFTGKERWQFIYIKFSKIYISIDGTSVMTELLVPRFTSSDDVCADSRTVCPSFIHPCIPCGACLYCAAWCTRAKLWCLKGLENLFYEERLKSPLHWRPLRCNQALNNLI